MGWSQEQIEASDVSLFSALMGYAITGRDLSALGVCLDGEQIPLSGDPIRDAATLIMELTYARAEVRMGSYYWRETVKAIRSNHQANLGKVAGTLARTAERLRGISFRPLDMMDHLAEVRDDLQVLVYISPPTYKAGYEKMFDTAGRITWNEPAYTVLDPAKFQGELSEQSKSWPCLLICLQGVPAGCGEVRADQERAVRRHGRAYADRDRPGEDPRERKARRADTRRCRGHLRTRPAQPPRPVPGRGRKGE